MFVASYARLPPGSRFHLSVNVQICPCNALYRVFAVTIWVGSDRLLQCAIPPRYHFITARALYYNARYRLGTARALCYNARYRLGTARALVTIRPSITMRGTASDPLGPSITMRGTASVPLGPSITMRGTASVPLGPSITMRGTASVPLRYRSGPLLQCAVPTPRLRFTKF